MKAGLVLVHGIENGLLEITMKEKAKSIKIHFMQ